ncbi:MAG: hypothetical protein C0490_05025 [Marivirga sp.]|nr:hypothetical protein [Marivirga sp.]
MTSLHVARRNLLSSLCIMTLTEETGKYFVGMLDFKDNLEMEGDNGGEYLLNRAKKLKDKLDK